MENSEGTNQDGKIILKCILEKQGEKLWIEFVWIRIGTNGWLLSTW
jgi:hypothetical protein